MRRLPVKFRRRDALARIEDWMSMPADERRRRIARALRDDDLAEILSLVDAWGLAFGRAGLRTSRHTLLSYRTGIRQLADFARSVGRKLHQLTRDDAYRYLRLLEARGRRPATVTARLAAARRLMHALAWTGMIEADPFDGIQVQGRGARAAGIRPYNDRELRRLVEMAAPRERVAVLLGCDAGLRVSEVAALRWKDVSVENRRLHVRRGKGGRTGVVLITNRMAEALQALRRMKTSSGDDLVIGVGARRIQQLFRDLCGEARVKHRGFHALRHAAGTRLYAATQDLMLVARHLRHASSRTSEIYVHLADRSYREGISSLEK